MSSAKKNRWVRFGTQIIGWEELTEFAPRNSVSPEKLTEFGVFEAVLPETVFGPFPVLPFLGCSVLTKENLQIYQGFSFPAEHRKTLEKPEKRPILARKFLDKNQPRKSKQSRKRRTRFLRFWCSNWRAFLCTLYTATPNRPSKKLLGTRQGS